jgi:very-short-patch-repair endonuclease
MMYHPRDYTKQETLIAECLTEIGLRYGEQVDFYPYTVDFYLSELKWVVEADGPYGHFGKREKKRDAYLMNYDEVEYILHITATSKGAIKEMICQELNN